MEIFAAKIENIIKQISPDDYIEDKEFKSVSRKNQYCAGRFLTKFVAENIYNLANLQINIKNKKPFFLNSDLKFNIAHSEDFVAVCFDNEDLGFDMEYMRERDFEKLMARYKIPVKDHKTIFYRFWCEYEAKLKLQAQHKSLKTFKIFNDYMAALAFSNERNIERELKVFKLNSSMEFDEILPDCFYEPLNVPV